MVWSFALRYPGHIAVAALALLVAAAATSGVPYAFKLIIDKGFHSGAGTSRDIARWFEYLLLLVSVMAVATAVRYYFVSWMGERTVADIRLAVHRNLLRLSPGFFEENRPAEITSRITVDTTIIEQVVGTTVSVALRNTVLGLACIVILFTLAPKLALSILLGSLLVVVPIAVLGRRVRAISTRSQASIADLGTVTSEVLGAMKIVQAFNQQGRETSRFAEAVGRVFATAKRRILVRAFMTAIVMFLIFAAITLVIWQGAINVAAGQMTGGTIAAFVLYGGLLAGAFGNISEVYGDLLRAAGASERLGELLDAEPDIRAPAEPAMLPRAGARRTGVRGCDFPLSDPARDIGAQRIQPRRPLTRAARGRRAFRGGQDDPVPARRALLRSGSRARPATGVDLRNADPADIRERIAMVPQDSVMFAASARDNLRYGNWDAPRATGRRRARPKCRSADCRAPRRRRGSYPAGPSRCARECRRDPRRRSTPSSSTAPWSGS